MADKQGIQMHMLNKGVIFVEINKALFFHAKSGEHEFAYDRMKASQRAAHNARRDRMDMFMHVANKLCREKYKCQ